MLVDLADEFPLLATLVERRSGGQRRLPIGGGEADARALVAASLVTGAQAATATSAGGTESAVAVAEAPESTLRASGAEASRERADEGRSALPGSSGLRKPARYGLAIQFEAREGDAELGRLVESTVWVNEAHPAYRRAVASRSEGYHVALSVAMALAPLAVEPPFQRDFVTTFLARWGETLGVKRR